MTGKRIGTIQMLICAFLWSTGGIFMKFVPWNPMVLSGIRSLVAGAVIGGYMLFKRIPFVLDKQTFASGVALMGTYTFFVIANKLTTAANAIVLQFTAPVFIVVLSVVFLHAKFSRRDVAAVCLTMVGIALFFLDQLSAGGMLGNISGIVAGISMATMYIINGEIGSDRRMSAIFIAQLLCFAVGLPFLASGEMPLVNGVTIGSIVFLGAVQLGFPYILYAKTAESCPALLCCLLAAIEPLLNPVWVFIFDGERPGNMALIGGVVVIITITVWNALGSKTGKAEAK